MKLTTQQLGYQFNNVRLLKPIGYIPPAEAEANYWGNSPNRAKLPALLKPTSLINSRGDSSLVSQHTQFNLWGDTVVFGERGNAP